MSIVSNTNGPSLKLKVLDVVSGPWQGALLPVPSFPVPLFQREQIDSFLSALSEVLTEQYQLNHEVLSQVWKLTPAAGGEILSENAPKWSPTPGLGIWPDRRPPQSWTEELMVDAAAAVFRGDEPEFPSYRLLLLQVEMQRERFEAARQMRGFGAQIELFSKETIDRIQASGKTAFLPAIKERRFQREGFYLPVLDSKSIAAADSTQKLDEWLCGIEVYVRESAEDQGILILSRLAIDVIVEQVQHRLEKGNLTKG